MLKKNKKTRPFDVKKGLAQLDRGSDTNVNGHVRMVAALMQNKAGYTATPVVHV